MTLLGQVFFPPADHRRTALSTIAWWEGRRVTYNLVVGTTGAFTVVVVRLITLIPPVGMTFAFDWRPIAVYGLLANVCYSLGWGIEIVLQRIMRSRAPALGPALYRQGLAFSVGLTLLPIVMVSIGWVAKFAFWLLGR